MLHKKHIVIVMLVLYVYNVKCENKKLSNFIECDPTKESGEKASTGCPTNSKCVELGTEKDKVIVKGLCACIFNFTVNRNYSSTDNNSRYCIENPTIIVTTQAPPTTPKSIVTTLQSTSTVTTTTVKTSSTTVAPKTEPTTKKVENTTPKEAVESTTKASSDTTDKNVSKLQQKTEENQTHHIIGGIIVPIMIVCAFIGFVYGIRKYDMLERAQNYIRNRRTGGQTHQTRYDGLENDFDDDPLLI